MTRDAGGWLAVAVLAALLGGQLLGQPVLLGFVETDSMQPTLDPGDGFVAVPPALTGPPDRGDVVVYDARRLHDGGLVTHRVVGRRNGGYLTKGDANPFPDQDDVEPPVTGDRVVAEVLQVGGGVVVIPHLGTAVTTVRETVDHARDRFVDATGLYVVSDGQSLLRGIAVAAAILFVLGGGGRRRRDDHRPTSRADGVDARWVALGLAALVLLGPTTSALAASGSQQLGTTVAAGDPNAVGPGETTTGSVTLHNGGVVPMVVRFDAPPAVDPGASTLRLGGGDRVNATVTLTAPDSPGEYTWTAAHYWYPAILPRPVGDTLYGVHPWLPLVAVDLVVGLVVYLVSRRLLGRGRIRLDAAGLGFAGRRRSRR